MLMKEHRNYLLLISEVLQEDEERKQTFVSLSHFEPILQHLRGTENLTSQTRWKMVIKLSCARL